MALPAAKAEGAEALLAQRPRPAKGAAWAEAARDAACARLRAMGAPTRRDEYWRFTDPAPLLAPHAQAPAGSEPPAFGEIDALRLVFVDGAFRPDLSDEPRMEGVELQPLAAALSADIHWARGLFGALEAAGQSPIPRPFAALGAAMAEAGFALRVSGRPARPILFEYRHERPDADAAIHVVVKLEAGAEATLLETGPAAARFLKTFEIELGEGAFLRHVRAQGPDPERIAVTHVFARLGAAARLRAFTLTTDGRLTRNEYAIDLAGEGASGHVAGAAIGGGDFHHDDTVLVTHSAAHCESRQVFKKVLRSGGRGVFQGKILVKPGAQKTDGYQISQALLLDDDAEFDAKPELEIYADDVACSHGSTSGAVDEDALFYLRARGVPESVAKDMMVLAFVEEAVAEIGEPALEEAVRGRIGAWLARRPA